MTIDHAHYLVEQKEISSPVLRCPLTLFLLLNRVLG